jgi:hypothetical protein
MTALAGNHLRLLVFIRGLLSLFGHFWTLPFCRIFRFDDAILLGSQVNPPRPPHCTRPAAWLSSRRTGGMRPRRGQKVP